MNAEQAVEKILENLVDAWNSVIPFPRLARTLP
jgi:hypothetical protein